MNLLVHPSFDPDTGSWTYLLVNPGSGCCAIIDPVLNYDPATGELATAAADRLCEVVTANGYTVEWILETHVHADHLSAAAYLKERFVCAQTAIGEHVRTVQAHFADAWKLDLPADGRQFDRLLGDGERVCLGHTCGHVLHTPGHTPACVAYVFDRFAFIGDTLFMPDHGTARCDFPGGDAGVLHGSVQRLYALPEETRLLLCHDYPPAGRTQRFCTTVAEQRRSNRMLSAETSKAAFVAARTARDRELPPPRLLEPALCANLSGGVLPGWRWPEEGRAA